VPQPTPDDPRSQLSVLQTLAQTTGTPPKVLLPDSNSEHGTSPVVDPGSSATRLVPQGRGNYQLLGEIARGGMGVILKGHDTDLGRDVAVKVLDANLAKRPEVVRRFVEEAQIGGQLQHPGIVPVYELGLMADERPYFTMKLVKGRTLAALLQQRKALGDDRGRLLAIFEAVCQTMAYAHSKGVLHRDLKPANIMVGAFGEVQVVDWGLAKVLQRGGVADEKRAIERSTLLTVIETVRSGPGSGSDSLSGSVMGTPAYMAPEQAQGEVETLDERADVFSLGAILCEILTGKPPYEHREGESILLQAAKARLDPARARIEACDADPALKQLCLDGLTPSRATRPANAEEVAKAVHDFLTSVEARAQKAELAAAEARIKAAEERRARRLTVALGGTVLLALALGGAGWLWVRADREKRAEQVRTAVEAAFGESLQARQVGQPDEALASARRALALARTEGADPALLERAQHFVSQAEADVGAAERERTLRAQDETLRQRLVDLRLRQIETVDNRKREAELDKDFAQAFRDYGVDLEGDDVRPALARIRERDIAEDVALALDDWGRLRRNVLGEHSEQAENLLYLAMDLDPDPERLRMRKAIFDDDLPTLLELGAPENLHRLAPGSIWVLSATLWDKFSDHRPDVYRIYDEALHLYPGDYVLQTIGGIMNQLAGRNEAALACRTAALALRPDDVGARARAAESLYFLGRLTEAEGAFRACIALDPDNATPYYTLSLCLENLGDYAGALQNIRKALALNDNPEWYADLLEMRYESGEATKEEVLAALATETRPLSYVTELAALLNSPDPARHDPQEVLNRLRLNPGDPEWGYIVLALAQVRAGHWAEARAALAGHYAAPTLIIVTPIAYDFVRSLIDSHLGLDGEARECYARGLAAWNATTGGNPAAWEHSDVMRWRREAEAVLKPER
jgi:serine/threonine protein kinase/predicted negative regulator of RcsB-dependent stress response